MRQWMYYGVRMSDDNNEMFGTVRRMKKRGTVAQVNDERLADIEKGPIGQSCTSDSGVRLRKRRSRDTWLNARGLCEPGSLMAHTQQPSEGELVSRSGLSAVEKEHSGMRVVTGTFELRLTK